MSGILPVGLRHEELGEGDRPTDMALCYQTALQQMRVDRSYDGQLTFDKPSSLRLVGVFQDENQPAHLIFRDPAKQLKNVQQLGLEPAQG